MSTNINTVGNSLNGITGTGNFVGSASPTLTGNPAAPTQSASDNSTNVATTAYVTTAVANAVAGVNPAVAVQAATTQASDTSGLTYNNGVSGIGATFTGSNNTALTIDGFTFTTLGQRLLVKNDTQSPSGAFNGVYYVTQVQALALPPILTRALDYDTPSEMNNTGAIPVVNGTANFNTSWLLTSSITTVGISPLTYTQFSLAPSTIVTLTGTQTLTNKTLTSPTLTTPAIGTPASGNLSNCTNYSANSLSGSTLASGVTASSLTSLGTLGSLSISNTGTSATATVITTTSGSANEAGLFLQRGDQTNGYAQVHYATTSSELWALGLRAGDTKYHFYASGTTDVAQLDSSGNLNLSGQLTSGSFTVNSYSPTLGDGTNNFTQSTTFGSYIRLGQLVFVFIHIDWTNKGSASGTLRLSLPVVPTAADRISLTVGYANGIATDASSPQPICLCQAVSQGTYANLFYELAGTVVGITAAKANTGGSIYVSGVYY